jgi:tripartite-type tricarboxylate transporter receptor subunit TctC
MSRFGALLKKTCATLLGALLVAYAHGQVWPSKPIRVIYPYSAGGVGDTSFRIITATIETKIGQRFVIESRPGAAGNIGTAEVARATPDGYTLLIAPTASYSVNQFLFSNLGFDPLVAFEPISIYADAPLVVLVNSSVPVKNLKELVDFARANPGKLNFGSPGTGSPSHLTGELLSQITGRALVYIPYKGTPPMVQGLLANDIQLFIATLGGNIAHVRAGRLHLLAVTGKERMSEIPDVPTTAEAGFPELLASNWWGLAAPRGTDRSIVERLAAEVRSALADPANRKRIGELGMTPVGSTPGEFAAHMRAEAERWKSVIARGGIKAE